MKIGVWLAIAVVVLLPLYEVADYSEVWTEDGYFVLLGMATLLVGMALAGAKRLVDTVITVIAGLLRVSGLLTLSSYPRSFDASHSTGPPEASQIPKLCDLRL